MLLEFIFGLIVSMFLTGVLFWLLIRRLRLNENKANTFAPFYLLPVILALLIVAASVLVLSPRIKDIPYIIVDNYDIVETTVDESMLDSNGMVVDGRQYQLAQRLKPKAGTRVRLYVTPFSAYVMRIEAIASETTEKGQ